MQSISIEEYRILTTKKPSKYRSKKVRYFEKGEEKVKDSIKEYRRGIYLKYLEKSGEISDLQEQVPFVLQEKRRDSAGKMERAIKLIADYVYRENDKIIVEDVKSKITKKNPAYVIKRKMFKARFPEFIFREIS